MQPIVMAVALIALLLSACGGGGGGDSPPVGSSATFSGTVAIGEPLGGTTVLVLHESGAGTSATTDAAGRYSATLSSLPLGFRPLFIIQTRDPVAGVLSQPPAYPRLFSIANRTSGTVNLTPLTSLLVAQLLGEKQDFFANLLTMRSMPMPSDGDIAAAQQQVVNYLQQRPDPSNGNATVVVNASTVTDLIRTPFNAVPGNPHDDAIEALAQTLMNGETIQGLEEHMLARNDPPANLAAILSLDFEVNCVAAGIPNPALPVGRVLVSFRPTGQITFSGSNASYSHTLAANDTITLASAPFLEDRWRIDFVGTGTNDYVEFFDGGRRLSSISLHLPAAFSSMNCTPPTPVPLGTRRPSTLAQVRLLASSITNPIFTCPAGPPSFPGVLETPNTNTLTIQNNGALRVNNPVGHSLHLPSLGLGLTAVVVSNAGAVVTRVTFASFSRAFAGGFDSFDLSLGPLGNIQTINFGQQRNNAAALSKTCP